MIASRIPSLRKSREFGAHDAASAGAASTAVRDFLTTPRRRSCDGPADAGHSLRRRRDRGARMGRCAAGALRAQAWRRALLPPRGGSAAAVLRARLTPAVSDAPRE